MTRITSILVTLTFLTSCDCFQRVTGTVVDNETGRPIQGVTVYKKNKQWVKTITDTTGHFELSNISGGFRCPPMLVVSETKDYTSTETLIPAGGQKTIKMQRRVLESKTTLRLMQGYWYHEQDSLATLTINQNLWAFNHNGTPNESPDIFTISFTDKLPEYVNETGRAHFLILYNNNDTLKYEILGLTDTTLSLMYFPPGKILLYRRGR